MSRKLDLFPSSGEGENTHSAGSLETQRSPDLRKEADQFPKRWILWFFKMPDDGQSPITQ
jgi:hypothetical protein